MYTLLPVALPLILWILSRLFLPAGPYEMDHGNGTKPGTFFPLLILYQAFGYILVGLNVYGADWSYKHTCNLWVCGVFLAAALYSLLFAVLPLFFYEGYLHGRYRGAVIVKETGAIIPNYGPSNYTLGRYALTLSLGFSSVALLVYGVVMTALEVGR